MSCSVVFNVSVASSIRMSHLDIVRDYIKYKRKSLHQQLDWFSSQGECYMLIPRVASAVDHRGKRLSHQKRIRRSAIDAVKVALIKNWFQLKQSKDFASLHDFLYRLLIGINGVGPLYIYDAALRVGFYLNLHPCFVYLQRGALVGAKKIISVGRRRFVPLSDFPDVFWALAPFEMEDVLCIYKDFL